MANYEATKYDFDGGNIVGIEGIPTATIVPWTDSSIPSGFLECNGQSVSQSTYSGLFAIIGTTYGDPGGGNFNVPDLQDNVAVGKSNNKSFASTGGSNTVTPTGNVAGSTANATLSESQLASHTHPQGGNPSNGRGSGGGLGFASATTGSTGSGTGHSHNMSANFVGDASSVIQPYLTLIYVIKT
jgi:microcystin-dependent protein